MRNLNEDLIFEIISRLPLKEAIRFKLLNKKFYCRISNHIEHKHFCQSHHKTSNILFDTYLDPRINYQLQLDQLYPIKYVEQPSQPVSSIVSSCGGIVLIRYSDPCQCFCVFNPITKEFQLVPPVDDSLFSVGLAVDSITNNHSYRYTFRLVDVSSRWIAYTEKSIFTFKTFGVGSSQWEETHEAEFECILDFLSPRHAPVYLHNSMHWLFSDCKILAFDLEKSETRIIDGPLITDAKSRYGNAWFGGVQGSLVICHCLQFGEYVIYAYDHIYTKTWQIQHKIKTNYAERDYFFAQPFFDGERLFLFLDRWTYDFQDIKMHNASTKKWMNIATMPTTSCRSDFLAPFVPTSAKLYTGLYLHCQMSREKLPDGIGLMLDNISQLFSSSNIDNFHY